MSLDILHSCKKLRSIVTKRELKREYHIKKAPLPSLGKVTPSKIKSSKQHKHDHELFGHLNNHSNMGIICICYF